MNHGPRLLRLAAAMLVIALSTPALSCSSIDVDEAIDKAASAAKDITHAAHEAVENHDSGDSQTEPSSQPGNSPPSVSRPPRPTGSLTTNTPTPLASETVGPSGGKIVVDKPGDPLDGLEIEVPPGSYPDSREFDVSSAPIDSDTFGEYFDPVTPLISIDNGGGYSSDLMTVRIPVEVPQGYFAMAFYYDATEGTLEGIPFSAIDDDSITIVTRHFSDIAVSAIDTEVLEHLINVDIDSDFRPGIDDWQFVNRGSYIAPGGHCAGQTATELWYFNEQPDGTNLTLNGRYDRNGGSPATPNLWEDDSGGYRLASTVQKDIDWDSYGTMFQMKMVGINDKATLWAFAYAIQLTRQPQFVGIISNAGGGHAMVVYRIYEDNLYIADPNYPGNTDRRIEFANGAFKPYNSGANAEEIAAGHGKAYENIGYCATTALVEWSQIATRWNEFKAGTVGNGRFPEYQLVVRHDNGDEEPLVDDYESDEAKIRIVLKAAAPMAWALYDGDGNRLQLDADRKLELDDGDNVLGVAVWGDVNNDPQHRKWKYIDFQYLTVKHGEEECHGWMLDSVTTEQYYEVPSDAYYQDQVFEASETGSFSGSDNVLVYDPNPSGSADDIFAHHTMIGTWTPPPSCISPDAPVDLEMHCAGTLEFDQSVEWGTIYHYLLISNGSHSTDYGHINQELNNATTSADDSAVARIQMYEGFEGIEPQSITVRCGTQEGFAEYVYTYVWKG